MDKQREKLIELICVNLQVDGCIAHCNYPPCDKCKTIADHLLANGVIVPPVKVGDKVYWYGMVGQIVEAEIVSNHFSAKVPNVEAYSIPIDSIGKTVFLSREDAEKALRKEG